MNLKILFSIINKMNCEYCNSVFKKKSALNNHKNKAKYCLVIQGKIEPEPQHEKEIFKCLICEKILSSKQYLEIHSSKCNEGKYKCLFCEKILSTKQNLTQHLSVCLEKKDKELKELKELKEKSEREIFEKDKIIIKVNTQLENYIEQLENYKEQFEKQEENYKEQIKNLQDRLDKIANKAIDRPTIVTNTTTNNNLNIMSSIDFNNLDIIKDLIENKLSVNHVVEGQKGIAQFLVDSFLKDDDGNLKYKCTDKSRSIFKFLNSDGEINKDVDASKLITHMVDGGIKVKSVEIAKEWYTEEGIIDMTKYQIMHEPQQLILEIEDDSSTFRRELASRTIAN
jgi:hypothetical protein